MGFLKSMKFFIKFIIKLFSFFIKILEWFGFFKVKYLKHNAQVVRCVWRAWKRTIATDYEIDKKFYKARKKVFRHLWERDKKIFINFIKSFFKRVIGFFIKTVINIFHIFIYSVIFIVIYVFMFIIQIPSIIIRILCIIMLKLWKIIDELFKKFINFIKNFYREMLIFLVALKDRIKEFLQKIIAMKRKIEEGIFFVKRLPQKISSFFIKQAKKIQIGTKNLEKSIKKLPNSVENFIVIFEKVNYNWILTVILFLEFFFCFFLLPFLQVVLHKIWWGIIYLFLYLFHGIRIIFILLCFQVYMIVLIRFPSFSFEETYGEMKAYDKYPWVKRWWKKNTLFGKLELFFYFLIYLLNSSSYKDKQEIIFRGYMKAFEKRNKFVYLKKLFARFRRVIWKSCIFFRFFIYAVLEPFLKIFVMFICYWLLLFFFLISFLLYIIFFKQHFFVLLSPVHWYGRWGFQKTYKPFFKTLKKLYNGWCYFTCQFYRDVFSPRINSLLEIWCLTTCSVFWEFMLYFSTGKNASIEYAVACFVVVPFVYGILLLFVFFSKKILLSMRITMIERRGGIRIGPRTDFRNYVKELDKSPQLYEIVDEISLNFIPLLVSCEINFLRKFVLAVNRFFTVHTFLDLINIFENIFIRPVAYILHPEVYNTCFEWEWNGYEWIKTKTFALIEYIRILIKRWSIKAEDKRWETVENRRRYIEKMIKDMKIGGNKQLEIIRRELYWKEYKEMRDIFHSDIFYRKGLRYKPYSESRIKWNLFKRKIVTGLSIIRWAIFTVLSLIPLLRLPFEWLKNIFKYLYLRKKVFFFNLSQYFEYQNPFIHTTWGIILRVFFEGEANSEETQRARKFLVSRITIKYLVEYLISFKLFPWLFKFKRTDKFYWIIENFLIVLKSFPKNWSKFFSKIIKFIFFFIVLLGGIFYQYFSLNDLRELHELYENIIDDKLKERIAFFLQNKEFSLGGWAVLFPICNNINLFSLYTFFSGSSLIYDYAFVGEEELLKNFLKDIQMEAYLIYIFNWIILSVLFIYQCYFWKVIIVVLLCLGGGIFWKVKHKASKFLDLLKKIYNILKKIYSMLNKLKVLKKKKEKKKNSLNKIFLNELL